MYVCLTCMYKDPHMYYQYMLYVLYAIVGTSLFVHSHTCAYLCVSMDLLLGADV